MKKDVVDWLFLNISHYTFETIHLFIFDLNYFFVCFKLNTCQNKCDYLVVQDSESKLSGGWSLQLDSDEGFYKMVSDDSKKLQYCETDENWYFGDSKCTGSVTAKGFRTLETPTVKVIGEGTRDVTIECTKFSILFYFLLLDSKSADLSVEFWNVVIVIRVKRTVNLRMKVSKLWCNGSILSNAFFC